MTEEIETRETTRARSSFSVALARLLTTEVDSRDVHANELLKIFSDMEEKMLRLKRYKGNARKSMRALQRAYEEKLRLLQQFQQGNFKELLVSPETFRTYRES